MSDVKCNETEKNDNTNEKKVILYLCLITLVMIYVATFFIHPIIDRGSKKINDSTDVVFPDSTIDYDARIKIKQNGVDFGQLDALDMFRNAFYNNESIIAPGSMGTYNFTVENDTDFDYVYGIFFNEQNDYNVNMVYKIKLNGQYIFGSDDEWVTHQNFQKVDLSLKKDSVDLYTVEWRWEHTDYDTEIGQTEGANYKMTIRAEADRIM